MGGPASREAGNGGRSLPHYNLAHCLVVLATAAAFGGAPGAAAQTLLPNPTPEMYVANNQGGSRVVANGALSFDGVPFTCGKFPTVLDPLLEDYAAAPYKGFIILNPKLLPRVPTAVKLWIFHHECGHALGIAGEAEADCHATKIGRRAKWLTAEGLDQVCGFISEGKADALHPDGPVRCEMIRACYQDGRGGQAGASARRPSVSRQ
jgi:hypothetical protein